MPAFDANHCCLCSQELPPSPVESTEVQNVFPKGLKTLKKSAGQRDLQDLLAYLRTLEASGSSLYVHFQCHRKFTDTRRVSRDRQENSKKLRNINQFDWKSCCLFCGVKREVKREENKKWRNVITMELKESIMKKAKDRTDDSAISVLSRLGNCADLVIEKDAVNCEEPEKFVEEIHKKLDGETMATATIKWKDQSKSLESLINTVKIGDSSKIINPTILLTRLTAMAQREEDVEKYFNYEISPFPPSLFKDGLMRKSDKPSLRKAIMKVNDALKRKT